MSWKDRFAGDTQYNKLPELGPFKIEEEPESLGKQKYRCKVVCYDGKSFMLSTFESTIGNIVNSQEATGWAEAYNEGEFIRFKSAEVG
ncbi:MAG: hypothetical protein HN831_03475 [Waddliaceae bacterium]|jgi:hypothetical protein|nr:hypothetical protein [Waddliaceae bacterium]